MKMLAFFSSGVNTDKLYSVLNIVLVNDLHDLALEEDLLLKEEHADEVH